ncbi:hybrid sensor histidine kinase/response regulator transcription factor [Niabella terrae]
MILLLTAVIAITPLFGQSPAGIRYLGSSQGLSNSSVKCIFQDQRGVLWFGTYDGLNRYDGSNFTIFRNRIEDSASIPHNYICAIQEDVSHNLWVGTGQGLVRYNAITQTFTPAFYEESASGTKIKITSYITDIKIDPRGNIWIGTGDKGVLMVPQGQELAIRPELAAANNAEIAQTAIPSITIDSFGRVWVFISGGGLYRYLPDHRKLEPVNRNLGRLAVNVMKADQQGYIWMGTSSGLLRYEIAGNRIVRQYHTGTGNLTANYVTALFRNRDQLWVGTDGGGVDIIDIRTGSSINVDQKIPMGGLSSQSVLSLYIDRENRKWIGTLKGGVDILDPAGSKFTAIRKDNRHPDFSSNFITSFYQEETGNLWVGTEGSGLIVCDSTGRVIRKFQTPVLSSNTVSSIIADYRKNIWVTTFGGGVNRRSPDGRWTHYPLINDANGQENKIAIYVFEDREHRIWATSYENGRLYLLDSIAQRFRVFDPNIQGDAMSIYEDRNGRLWIGTQQLIQVDRQHRRHRYYNIGKTVRAIREDRRGNFWIAAEGGGLILFDRATGRIQKRYTEANGLSSNTLLNLLEDNNGNLWISSSNGLNKFDPVTEQFNRFYESDGLQGNQFAYRAALKLHSGSLVFGGNNGFNIFDPARIVARSYMPSVVISSIKINNQLIAEQHRYRTDSLGNISQLTLPFREGTFSIQFAALEYTVPDKIQYAYYLEGWDKDWNQNGSIKTVTYNNIREGQYTLHIKSTNAEGVWNPKETLVNIRILPPWYRTWWAYSFYLLAVGGLLFLYMRYKTNQARMQYDLQLARLNEEMRLAELESARMEKEVQRAELERTHAEFEREKAERETDRVLNEQEKEINKKRLSFFTNISHEFRTPLTMIINPVMDLMKKYGAQEKEDLRIIGLNATRLLNLTDQLLLFRKIEEGVEGLQVSRFDFCKLCDTVFHYFRYEAKTRHIRFEIEGINQPLFLYGDKAKIEIILYNLIGNAFKYSSDDGCIQIHVEVKQGRIHTSFSDKGSGIPEGTGEAIFERFYQAAGGSVKLGFGIGLYLVKQFTEMHQGTIQYESTPGQGTVFMLELPLGKAHWGQIPIQEISDDYAETMILPEKFEQQEIGRPYMPKMPELTKGKAILVVDDDEEMLHYVESVFVHQCVVYKAANGREGLELATRYRPDLIISDVSMPEMDGIELCRMIKNDPVLSHLPVILLTAYRSQEIELKGTEEGADYYITKPFSKELLLARVSNLFRSRDSLRQYFYQKVTLQSNPLKEPTVPAEYKDLLERCIHIVEAHLDDPAFNIEQLSRELAMSHSNLYKKIKQISGQSVTAFIRFIRLRKAAELLVATNESVTDIAYKVGFNDVKYFREQFSRLFKMKPNEYMRLYRGKLAPELRIDNQGTR